MKNRFLMSAIAKNDMECKTTKTKIRDGTPCRIIVDVLDDGTMVYKGFAGDYISKEELAKIE